ncbi:MAG: sel1 repeat family protein [Ectothiorhodospiraceae bacterium]|nr:sel1 repeat family protein [Ectothiorhodospiraceae bacterium]
MARDITASLLDSLPPQGQDHPASKALQDSRSLGPGERYHSETTSPPVSKLEQTAAGDPAAELALGNRYRRGEGVAVNPVAAWNHYVTAARGGNLEAMTNIGVMYDQGQTVAPNPEKACSCYRYAAERGFAVAQYNLGIMYARGIGVGLDEELALHWFGAAAAQGYAPAIEARDWLAAQRASV